MKPQSKKPLLARPQPVSPLFARMQSVLSDITGIDPEDIGTGMEFDELSMSPVELAEFFATVQSEHGYKITRDDLEDYPTIGELALHIEDELE